jgi:type I restriction enzyme S subunit
MRGNGVGQIAFCSGRPSTGLINAQMLILRPECDALNSRFLYYLLSTPFYFARLRSLATGSAQPQLSISSLRELDISIPQPEDQKKIAAILSAYDDPIENNTRRIKILEEMAQSIYREWFVNFRFPGHEKVKMVDSPMGKMPKEWEIRTFDGLVDIKSGFAFPSKIFVEEGEFGLVTIKNVKDGKFLPECEKKIETPPPNMPSYCHVKTGDILLSLTGNVGRTCLVYGDRYLLNQRVAKLVPKPGIGKPYVYLTFRQIELQQKLVLLSTGVAQQNLSPINMGKMEIIFPKLELLKIFAEICNAFIEEIISLNLKILNLRQTRNLLLPKLISGELDVSELDIKTEEIGK